MGNTSRKMTRMTSNPTIREIKTDYFHWLCEIICIDQGDDSYWSLARALHAKDFYWSVPNDDNRGIDGLGLRNEYTEENGYGLLHRVDSLLDGPCTMLEMLIGLARRIEESMAELGKRDQTPKWFWEMMDNLGFTRFTDANFTAYYGTIRVENKLNEVLNRHYRRNGEGGLFPLKIAKKDQRKVEIWYQMNAYLVENYFIDGEIL